MALAAGSKLGVYSVLDPLGSGGMGEVYRALDTRLGREVAIKGLPEEFSRDPARLSRFEREARMLAALNHPSVAAIYGLEEVDGTKFIVMELVPGDTLSEKLSGGGLALDESLLIARQIAEALEAAHERGIIHRDLKPANIKVTPEGRVKVLDLGLAKAFDAKETGPDSDASLSPTLVLEGTQPGVILGTAEFMSPEQARGKPVDKRTDIWAFGCIVYEMLAGRRAFAGETATDVLAAIVTSEPRWDVLPPTTPPRIRDLLGRCLQKDPNRRLRDIGDARIQIDEALGEIGARRAPISASFAPTARRRTPALALVVGALVIVGVWLALRGRHAPRVPAQKSMAILPFQDFSGQADGQLLGDAFAETMSARLGRVPGLEVVTPRALAGVSPSETDFRRVSQETGATLVLRGALQRVADRYRVTYSLVRAPEGVQVAGDAFTGSASEMFAIQDRMADSVLAFLDVKKPQAPLRTPGLEAGAQVTYLKAIGALQHYDAPASVDTAIRLLTELNRQEPYSALVLAALGRAYLHKFELTHDAAWADKAIAACEPARKLDDRVPEVHTTLGQVLALTGKPAEAAAEFEQALAQQPSSIDALLGLAAAYLAAGRIDDARNVYQRAAAEQPNYWAVYNHFGSFYYRLGRYPEAIAMFEQAVRHRPESSRAYNNLGAAYFKSDRFAGARKAFERSIQIEPNAGAYSGLGNVEYFVGNYRSAAAAFEQAAKLVPGNYVNWANLADAYRWTPELKSRSVSTYESAARLAESELKLNPKSAYVHATLATCYAKTGKVAAAHDHLDRALELEPANPDLFLYAAIVANLAGRSDDAIGWIRKAVAGGVGVAEIEHEPELNNLRGLPTFREAISAAKKKK
ncbi:MAG TPA: tetratricopeptide repeat protein [Thermoanaerobaculia bacterium]